MNHNKNFESVAKQRFQNFYTKIKKWLRHFFIQKTILGLVFDLRKCDYTFVNWYKALEIFDRSKKVADLDLPKCMIENGQNYSTYFFIKVSPTTS
jgi:hypothetical protein